MLDAAGRVMQGLAEAGRTVVNELQVPAQNVTKEGTDVKNAGTGKKNGGQGEQNSAKDENKETA